MEAGDREGATEQAEQMLQQIEMQQLQKIIDREGVYFRVTVACGAIALGNIARAFPQYLFLGQTAAISIAGYLIFCYPQERRSVWRSSGLLGPIGFALAFWEKIQFWHIAAGLASLVAVILLSGLIGGEDRD
ncbi:MAG: hypothetical protein HC786_20400 [Richelia sp. CSU_2_1]|nr:hypothetical protein [Richelia sp. CSU_2_1]